MAGIGSKRQFGIIIEGDSMLLKLKGKDGSITVEAAIILPIFMCVMLTFGFLIKVFYVHEIFHHAITEAASEMSIFSYAYYAGGLYQLQKEIDEGLDRNAEEMEEKIKSGKDYYEGLKDTSQRLLDRKDKTLQDLEELKGHIAENEFDAAIQLLGAAVEDLKGSKAELQELLEALKGFQQLIGEAYENPEAELGGWLALLGKEAWKDSKTLLGNALVGELIKKHLLAMGEVDTNKKLSRLNVVDGVEGIDFSESSFLDGNENIVIVIKYRLQVPLPINILGEIPMRQRVMARAWMGGELPSELPLRKTSKLPEDLVDEIIEAGYDVWALPVIQRAKDIKALLGGNVDENFPIVDKKLDDTITSIRTHDTRLKSNHGESFMNQLREDLRRISDFYEGSYRDTSITKSDYIKKELNLAVPDVELTEVQIRSLYEIIERAAEKSVSIKLTVVR